MRLENKPIVLKTCKIENIQNKNEMSVMKTYYYYLKLKHLKHDINTSYSKSQNVFSQNIYILKTTFYVFTNILSIIHNCLVWKSVFKIVNITTFVAFTMHNT